MPVAHLDLHQGGAARGVTRGVLQQVADEAGEQPAFARHPHRLAREVGAGARGLLRSERLKVDSLQVRGPLQGAEAARQQDLLDQLVEVLDVPLDAGAERRIAVLRQQFHGHANAGEGRAQLVRRGGERVALGRDERLNALRRLVEAAGQRRDLVLALDLHPRGEIACAQCLDPALQPFQPSRQAAGEGIGADGDGDGEEGEGGEETDRRPAENAPVRAHEDEAPVRERQGKGAALPGAPAGGLPFRRREGLTQAREQLAVRPEHADTAVDIPRQPSEGGVQLGLWCIGRRQRLGQQCAEAPAKLRAGVLVTRKPPAEGGEHAEQHDDAEQRQINLEEEAPPHASSSWLRVNR